MDIFFCCTSMAHLFTAAYISEKYYKDTVQKKLILLSQMNEMIKLTPNIMQSGLWNDIKVIDNEARELSFIQEQVNSILKESKSKFYLFGFENVSFSIVHMASEDDTIAFVDDGGMTYNFREGLKKTYHKELFENREFPLQKIKELWLTETRMIVDDFGAECIELSIGASLQDKTFRVGFLDKLKKVFNICNTENLSYDIVFFDTYLASIDWISVEFEEFMLQEIVRLTGNSSIAVKAHPNEKYWDKYSKLNLSLMENSIVPWEVTVLLQNAAISLPRIYMTNVSSVVLKQRLVLGDTESYIIFLYHIYEKYCPSLKGCLETASIDRYMEVLQDKKMFFPKTFGELADILKQIGVGLSEVDCREKNAEDFFIEEYWNLWKKTPSDFNFTTIYYRGKETKIPIVFKDKVMKLYLVFDLAKAENTTFKTEGDDLFWHVIRGIAVKTRVVRIAFENEDGHEREITVDEIFQMGERDEEGYLIQYNLDAIYKLPAPEANVMKIRINAEICVLNTYEEMENVFRERMKADGRRKEVLQQELESEQKTARKLLEDIEDRDNVLKQMTKDLENRDNVLKQLKKDMEDRDNVLKQLTKDLENRDSVLKQLTKDVENRDGLQKQLASDIRDRDEVLNQLMQDISNRDSLIEQFQKDKRNIEKRLADSEGKIEELEDAVSDFQNSFWGRMYAKCRR